jgi:hypothetical protein
MDEALKRLAKTIETGRLKDRNKIGVAPGAHSGETFAGERSIRRGLTGETRRHASDLGDQG